MRWLAQLACLLAVLAGGGAARADGWRFGMLSAAEEREAAAFSAYLWASFLEAEEEQPDREVLARAYLLALAVTPDSAQVLGDFISLWGPGEERNAVIVRRLGPLAAAHPVATRLTRHVAWAHLARREYAAAAVLLERNFRQTRYDVPAAVTDLAYCWERQGRLDDVHRLLAAATAQPALRNEFSVIALASRFYDRAAYAPRSRLRARQRAEFQRLAYRHALHAAELPVTSANHDQALLVVRTLLDGEFLAEGTRLLERMQAVGPLSADATKLLAACYSAAGAEARALALWDQLCREFPHVPEYQRERGQSLWQLGQTGPALAALSLAQFLQMDPALKRNWQSELVVRCLQARQPQRALEYLTALSAAHPQVQYLRAQAHLQLGRLEEALAALQSAVALARAQRPGTPAPTAMLALQAGVLARLGRAEEALPILEDALDHDPDNIQLCNHLGYQLADLDRDLFRAEALVHRAVLAAPAESAFHDSLAWVWFRQRRLAAAAAEIATALRLHPGPANGIILEHAGDIYRAWGRPTEALRFWQQAAEAADWNVERVRRKLQAAAGP